MLFLSLLLMLGGVSLAAAAGVIMTYIVISAGEKDIRPFLSPRNWPLTLKKWARYGGVGLGTTLLGMILAMIAT